MMHILFHRYRQDLARALGKCVRGTVAVTGEPIWEMSGFTVRWQYTHEVGTFALVESV